MRDLQYIKDVVEEYFNVELQEKSRNSEVVKARFFYFYLAKTYTKKKLRQIGGVLSKDHSTVIHGIKKITEQCELYEDDSKTMKTLENKMNKYFLKNKSLEDQFLHVKKRIENLEIEKINLQELILSKNNYDERKHL